MGNNMNSFILILYVAIIIFFIYRLYKSFSNKKKLAGEIAGFNKKSSPLEWLLMGILLATGIVNFVAGYKQHNQDSIIMAIIMVVLAIVFGFAQRSKLYIAENGILINSNFYNYKQLKKWGFDKEGNDLVLQVKKDRQSSNEMMKVKAEDTEEINTLIRRNKINK